ncbi:hypothetical protein BHE74_00051030 [Ensete ventricosum]|nr:hypothetical protein BHE74_00051030 [Ensete ventricosum]RZS16023.1 hypothetical protein BHM03_00047961 [Ensete ventricosum]
MKVCHDFKSAVTEGALAVIQKNYSIMEEYALHVPLPKQRPYTLGSSELSISVDALEASAMDLSTRRGMPKVSTSKSTLAARITPSSPKVEEVRIEATPRTWPGHQKVDDDLLKAMKELEAQRTELPKKVVGSYKASARWHLVA